MPHLDACSILIRVRKLPGVAGPTFVHLRMTSFITYDLTDVEIDFDSSRLIVIGEREAAKLVFDALVGAFSEKTTSNMRRLRSEPILSKPYPHFHLLDDDGVSIVDQMVQYITANRIFLGDEGSWKILTLREYFLKRPGIHLSEAAQADIRRQLPIVNALPDADYTDELVSFRFPSTSCLYGVSHPLAQLRGAVKFGQLFIRDGAGVYVAFDENEALYVGMTRQFSKRLSNVQSHHKLKIVMKSNPHARVALIHYPVWKSEALQSFLTSKEEEAAWGELRIRIFSLETACIKYYRPRYNGTGACDDFETP